VISIDANLDCTLARWGEAPPSAFKSLRLIKSIGSSSNIPVMKKLVVLLLIVTGFAFLGEPTARAGIGFVFGLPVPVPFFFGPGYYGPGPYYGAPYYGYGNYYGHGPYWRNRYYNGYYGRGYYGGRYYRGGYYGGRYYRGGYYGGRSYGNWNH
jgi:hypothetical protein